MIAAATVMRPVMMKAQRQEPKTPMIEVTMMPPTALPKAPAMSMNVAPRARSLGGIQALLIFDPDGAVGASKAPRPSRAMPRPTPEVRNPIEVCTRPQVTPAAPTTLRAPKRSSSQPPGIWKIK